MSRILGIAGTAKNTGKTTTLQAVVRFLRQQGVGVFLTSIGYDGEDTDTVTGLPKPKVVVEEGDMVATALPLLEASPARFTRLKPAGVVCALGPVYYGIAASPGRVVLAGPVSTKDVAEVCRVAPPDRTILLDGAFSRLAPMVLADALILATGAARSPDPSRIASEIETLATVFGVPAYAGKESAEGSSFSDADLIRFPAGLYVDGQDEGIAKEVSAALGLEDGRKPATSGGAGAGEHGVSGAPDRSRTDGVGPNAPGVSVLIDGVVNPTVFASMVRKVRDALSASGAVSGHRSLERRIEFVLANPVFMLLSGEMSEWKRALEGARQDGFWVSVRRKPNLLGFTVNPFRPEFDPIRNAYSARYVDAAAYLEEIRSLTGARCADIVYEGTSALESWLTEAGFGKA
ncbi:MAG: hypothetical protein ACOX5M_00500 [Bacillota bacterium]|jgi:hypothetical protein